MFKKKREKKKLHFTENIRKTLQILTTTFAHPAHAFSMLMSGLLRVWRWFSALCAGWGLRALSARL
jgi:hypothetical protein